MESLPKLKKSVRIICKHLSSLVNLFFERVESGRKYRKLSAWINNRTGSNQESWRSIFENVALSFLTCMKTGFYTFENMSPQLQLIDCLNINWR